MEQFVSFSKQVKNELNNIAPSCPHCDHAQAYGMLLFGKGLMNKKITLQTEVKPVVDKYVSLIIELTGTIVTITCINANIRKGNRLYIATIEDELDSEMIRRKFGHEENELETRLLHQNIKNDCCMSAFLRGVFMVCGTVIDPQKEYHLEFVVPSLKLTEDLQRLIQSCGIDIKWTTRKGSYVLYLKESEHIEDVITFMGAVHSSLEIMNIKIVKDVRNKVNRVTNCETANIEKTVIASSNQIHDIMLIEKEKGFSWLPDDLKEIAELRLENPDMSLRELGQQLSSHLSRSGVNHRLKRLSKLAEDLKLKQKYL
ncbi:MAG: hypothetical protein K0R90_873 [Oscillospiraceae bacterium]|nr:hypothetical protein [Oscillospiraceae bacterium]